VVIQKGNWRLVGTEHADCVLYYKLNIPIALIKANDSNHSSKAGIQQALNYAEMLNIRCILSSNGDGFLFHDRTTRNKNIETELSLNGFPSSEQLRVNINQHGYCATRSRRNCCSGLF
jgi:type I restriction enzyme R subunit